MGRKINSRKKYHSDRPTGRPAAKGYDYFSNNTFHNIMKNNVMRCRKH